MEHYFVEKAHTARGSLGSRTALDSIFAGSFRGQICLKIQGITGALTKCAAARALTLGSCGGDAL